MPSEDLKNPKKEEFDDDDDDDNMCLGSILREKSKSKHLSAPNVSSSKLQKPKKEDNTPDPNSSRNKPISKPVKKLEPPSDDDDEPIGKRIVSKVDNKSKSNTKNKKVEEVKKKMKVKLEEMVTTKRERKVYALPGQKRDPPEERDPSRIFYESLYEQMADSEMAAIWMMESGLLSADDAKKVYERKQKRAQNLKLGSPMKCVSTEKRVAVSKSATAKMVKDPSSNSSTKRNVKTKVTAVKTTVTSVKTKKRKKDESSESEESEGDENSEDDFVISKVVKKRKV